MLLALVTLSLIGDVAPGPFVKRPAPPPAQCQGDGDCVLSTWDGCCGGCCPSAPHAVRRGVNEAAPCAAIDCALPRCEEVRCAQAPDPTVFVAACRAGRCVAVAKSAPAPSECRANADCSVRSIGPPGAACHRSPCGCCPVSQALPVDAVVPLQKKPLTPKTPPDVKPDFGLSTGGAPAPQAPNCSPCPAPSGGTAACQGRVNSSGPAAQARPPSRVRSPASRQVGSSA